MRGVEINAQSGFESKRAVIAELDVKSFGGNVLCSEFIMCCFQPIDVCSRVCALCAHVQNVCV